MTFLEGCFGEHSKPCQWFKIVLHWNLNRDGPVIYVLPSMTKRFVVLLKSLWSFPKTTHSFSIDEPSFDFPASMDTKRLALSKTSRNDHSLKEHSGDYLIDHP